MGAVPTKGREPLGGGMQGVDRVWALQIRTKCFRKSLVELLAVEVRVSGDAMADWTTIVFHATFSKARPAGGGQPPQPVFQSIPVQAELCEHCLHGQGSHWLLLAKSVDAPCAVWVAQHNP